MWIPGQVIDVLKENPNIYFTSKEIAELIFNKYPDECNKKFDTYKEAISRMSDNISSHKNRLLKHNISWIDNPPPRRYIYKNDILNNIENFNNTIEISNDKLIENDKSINVNTDILNNSDINVDQKVIHEKELYEPIIEYLSIELNLYSVRIRENKSKNRNGPNGNKWLHPDIVSMKILDDNLNPIVQECFNASKSLKVSLLSFEVKKDLTLSNLKEYFFQAVSNSSWANESYLIVTSIANNAISELRILSSLHGIGVILFNEKNILNSSIIMSARSKYDVDWQSINRLVNENSDFLDYMDNVRAYLIGNMLNKHFWNKTHK